MDHVRLPAVDSRVGMHSLSLYLRLSILSFFFFSSDDDGEVQGIFGMNVDVLIDEPPSIRWYFAAVVPFSALILALAFVSTRVNQRRGARSEEAREVLLKGKEKPFGL